MNVALSNAPTPAAASAPIAPGADASTGDTPVDGSASTPAAFDAMFTKHLADGRDTKTSSDGKAVGSKDEASDPSAIDAVDGGDGKATGASPRRGPAVDPAGIDAATTQPTLATPTASSSTTASSDALRRGKDGDKDGNGDDRADDGSAAQLAVISQWANVTKPVATVDTPPPNVLASATSAVRAGLDAKSGRVSVDRELVADSDAKSQPAVPTAVASTAPGKAEATGEITLAPPVDMPPLDPNAITATSNATIALGNLFATRLATTTSTATPTPTAPTTPTTLHETVGTGAWSQEVGQVALRMAANDLQSASLRLNPEHLGPLDVQVRVDNGVTHVAFNAAHADTRQALEASRTTLDQMFNSQGIKMGDVSVGQGSVDLSSRGPQPGGAQADASRRDGGHRWSGNDAGADDADGGTTITTRIVRTVGLVDTFA